MLPRCTALDQHLPKQMYPPHSSISSQRLPSHRTRRTRRPTSSIHIAAASGSSSRATAHDGSTSGKESPSTPSGNVKSRTQCSVPSAESYGALPAEASPVVSRETSPSPRETAAMPPTPVGRRTLSRSDLPCFTNRRHSICPAQTGCICHVLPRQQYVVSHRARRIQRETATEHWEAASSCSSRATAYALAASEEGEGITSHQHLEITAPALGDVCRVSRNIAVRRFTIGFT